MTMLYSISVFVGIGCVRSPFFLAHTAVCSQEYRHWYWESRWAGASRVPSTEVHGAASGADMWRACQPPSPWPRSASPSE